MLGLRVDNYQHHTFTFFKNWGYISHLIYAILSYIHGIYEQINLIPRNHRSYLGPTERFEDHLCAVLQSFFEKHIYTHYIQVYGSPAYDHRPTEIIFVQIDFSGALRRCIRRSVEYHCSVGRALAHRVRNYIDIRCLLLYLSNMETVISFTSFLLLVFILGESSV